METLCPSVQSSGEAVRDQLTLGGILRAFLPVLLHLLNLGAPKLRVLWQLAACGTPALGANLFHCPHCQHRHWAPRSCGNRHCPQRIFVDFAVPHDNAKISVGFFEGPEVFQGIAIGESTKQCDQGRLTKHNAPHPYTGQNAGCAQHWRSAVALDDNPARNRPIAIVTQTRKRKAPTRGTPRLSTSTRVSHWFAAPSPSAVANVMIPSMIFTGPRAFDRLS